MDISAVPNPFQGVLPGVFEDSDQTQLTLVDGVRPFPFLLFSIFWY